MDWRLILLIVLLFGGMSYVNYQGKHFVDSYVSDWNEDLKEKGEI